jgi:hypothetical protein
MNQFIPVNHLRNDQNVMADKGDVNVGWGISHLNLRDKVDFEPPSNNLEIILNQHSFIELL